MSLDQKYEFLEPLPALVVHSDKALKSRQISSGRAVTIHLLAGGHSIENAALLQEIETLPVEYRGRVLDIGDYHGTPTVVTETLPGEVGLRKWVAGLRAAPAEPDANALSRAHAWKIPSGVSRPEPGEFTSFMKLADPGEGQMPAAPVAPGPKPDESTRMLTVSTPQPAAGTPPAPAPAPVAEPPKADGPSEPGQFTRFLLTLKPEQEPATPPAPGPATTAAPPEPGEFTRFLKRSTPQQTPEPGPAAPPKPLVPPPAEEPGEFTRMFQAVTPPAPEPESVAPAAAEPPKVAAPPPVVEFMRLSDAATPLGESAAPPAAEPSRPAVAPPAAEPGEFTRMFQAATPRAGTRCAGGG